MRSKNLLVFSTFALLAACSGSSDPVVGTWNEPNGTIQIPQALGGGSLDDAVTLTFDDTASPSKFDLKMALSFQGLTDTLDAQGTYTVKDGSVTFDFTGFALAAGDTSSVADDGSQCVTLNALAGATVCFTTPQTDAFQLSGDTLTLAIDNRIVGADAAPTTLTLTRGK